VTIDARSPFLLMAPAFVLIPAAWGLAFRR
jgi:hypothetical protein